MDEPDIRIYLSYRSGMARLHFGTTQGAAWIRNNLSSRDVSNEVVPELQAQMEQAGLTVTVR